MIVMSPKSKHWWTKELSLLCRTMNKLGGKASKFRNCPWDKIHAKYEDTKKMYMKEIETSKWNHWRDWLEKTGNPDIWTANKYISAAAVDGNNSRISP